MLCDCAALTRDSMIETRIREDFDEIARLSGNRGGSGDCYDRALAKLVLNEAETAFEIGRGPGCLAARLAASNRTVTSVELSLGGHDTNMCIPWQAFLLGFRKSWVTFPLQPLIKNQTKPNCAL